METLCKVFLGILLLLYIANDCAFLYHTDKTGEILMIAQGIVSILFVLTLVIDFWNQI